MKYSEQAMDLWNREGSSLHRARLVKGTAEMIYVQLNVRDFQFVLVANPLQ